MTIMMTAIDHQPRQSPTQWQWEWLAKATPMGRGEEGVGFHPAGSREGGR